VDTLVNNSTVALPQFRRSLVEWEHQDKSSGSINQETSHLINQVLPQVVDPRYRMSQSARAG